MVFSYSHESNKTIAEHEDKMFAKFSKIIEGYAPAFMKYGCVLNVGRGWIPSPRASYKGIESDNRLPFKAGYACYIYCTVKRNGKIVRYDAKDGEADYYDLSMSWEVSLIKRFFGLKYTLYDGEADFIETLDHFMATISSTSVEFIAYYNQFVNILGI